MKGTLLDKISKYFYDTTITDAWLTGQIGMIVDLNGDYVFRFIEYNNDNGQLTKIHATEESMLSCPIVACGIVGYWLHERDTKGIKVLFEAYFNLRLNEYKKAHENDADAWKRDLEHEFVCNYHIYDEKVLIKASESLFAYVTESDQEDIKSIMDNYLAFARSQCKKLYPNYPADRILEETFLDAFREGGPACICLNWLRSEFKLPAIGPHRNNRVKTSKTILSDDFKKGLDKLLFEDVAEQYEDFDFDVLLSKNGLLMEEIHEIIKNLKTQEDRKWYIIHLILQFEDFAKAFEPKAQIDEKERIINMHNNRIKKWEEMPDDAVDEKTGELILPKKQIAESNQTIENLSRDIEYLKKVQKDLYWFVQLGANLKHNKEYPIEVIKMCKYLRDWWRCMVYFANRLASLALLYRIDLKNAQEECGVYLLRQLSILNYVDKRYIASAEYARKLLDEIDANKHIITPDNIAKYVQKDNNIETEKINIKMEETTKRIESDFVHLKNYLDNDDLDFYLSEDHWNFHVNSLLYKQLLIFYEGIEVGAFLNQSNNPAFKPINDYSLLYGNLFNEAYRLCSDILAFQVPETKVALLANQAATWKFRNLKDEDGNTIKLVPNVTDLIESYHILGMANAILTFANDQKNSVDRFLISLSVYKDVGLFYCGYTHSFEYYNEVYEIFICTTMIDGSYLRPGYDNQRRDTYLRKNIPWYSNIALEIEKKMQESEDEKPTYNKEQNNINCQQFFGPITNCTINLAATPLSSNKKNEEEATGKNVGRTDCCFLYNNDEYFAIAIQEFTNKLRFHKLIPDDMDCKKMESLFRGHSCRTKYTWLGPNHVLTHIIKGLTDEDNPIITTWPESTSKWDVVSCRFIDKDGNPLPNIRKETARKGSETVVKDAIKALAGYL